MINIGLKNNIHVGHEKRKQLLEFNKWLPIIVSIFLRESKIQNFLRSICVQLSHICKIYNNLPKKNKNYQPNLAVEELWPVQNYCFQPKSLEYIFFFKKNSASMVFFFKNWVNPQNDIVLITTWQKKLSPSLSVSLELHAACPRAAHSLRPVTFRLARLPLEVLLDF